MTNIIMILLNLKPMVGFCLLKVNPFNNAIAWMLTNLSENFWWIGLLFIIPALVIFIMNLNDNEDGKGGSLGFYGFIMPLLVSIGCFIKSVRDLPVWTAADLNGEWTWFLILLVLTVIQQLIALIRNFVRVRKGFPKLRTLWLVIPFFLLIYIGFTIAMNLVACVIGIFFLVGFAFSWLDGSLVNKKELSDGTKIEGIGDDYHDKYGHKYRDNHDGSVTKLD